jgi:exopolysaccharide production protein ExoZ
MSQDLPTEKSDAAKEPRIENLQALRGIAILLVLSCHVGVYEARCFGAEAWLRPATVIGWAGVDFFFVISGFVMMTITRGRFQQPGTAPTFFLRRAARIYPLYWLYTLAYLPLFLFQPDVMNRPEGSAGISLLHSFLLLPHSKAPLVGQGWTLVHEMYFYTVFALILLRPEREKLKLLFVWATLVLAGCVLGETTGLSRRLPTLALVTHLMTLEFIAGCLIAELVHRGVQCFSAPAIVLGMTWLPLTLLLPRDWNRVLLWLMPAALVVYGAVAIEARRQFRFPRPLCFIGDISYSLYLSHLIPIQLVSRAFRALHWQHGIVSHVAFIVVTSTAAIALGAASYYWVEKPLLRRAYALVPRLVSVSRRWRKRNIDRRTSNAERRTGGPQH